LNRPDYDSLVCQFYPQSSFGPQFEGRRDGCRIAVFEHRYKRLHHPRFAGIRSDKDARDVVREELGFVAGVVAI